MKDNHPINNRIDVVPDIDEILDKEVQIIDNINYQLHQYYLEKQKEGLANDSNT